MNINSLEDAFINIGIEDEKIKIENTMKIDIENKEFEEKKNFLLLSIY